MKNSIFTHHFVLAVFFICVTIAAIVFKQSNILFWYALGAILEILYRIPSDSWRGKNNDIDRYGGYEGYMTRYKMRDEKINIKSDTNNHDII